jgi:hypothetical protein
MGRIRNPIGAIAGFGVHLVVFIIAAMFFFQLNMRNEGSKIWWYWPVLGWGIGIAFHALGTVGTVLDMATGGVFRRGPIGALGSFVTHLFSYITVIGALYLMNTMSGDNTWWIWPAIGWGIGIVFHALGTAFRLVRLGFFASRGI